MTKGIMNNEFGIRIIKIIFLYSLFLIPYSISAQSVDLLWQGETYTPPFFEGRALWTKQSRISIVAVPQGLGSASALNYRWTKNGTVLGNISGAGKNLISFEDTILSKPQTIMVEVVSGSRVLASATTVVVPADPEVLVYENNPLYGYMFHQAVGSNYNLNEQEVTFSAFPLFFSTFNRADTDLKYEWQSNAGEKSDTNSVTYRTLDDASGAAEVMLSVKSLENITQSARGKFLINFDSSNDPEL